MKKFITISKIGYNHPSQANWSYSIWKVDIIDTEKDFNMSYTTTEAFGGDSRFKEAMQKANIKVIETKGVYTSTGYQKITGIRKLPDMESKEFINEVIELIK